MQLDLIKTLVINGKIKWTNHCLERMGERDISIADVKKCVANGEMVFFITAYIPSINKFEANLKARRKS